MGGYEVMLMALSKVGRIDGSQQVPGNGKAGENMRHHRDGVSGNRNSRSNVRKPVLRPTQQNTGGKQTHPDLDGHKRSLTKIKGYCHQIIPFGRKAVPNPDDRDDGIDYVECEEQKDGSRKGHKVFSY